MGKNKLKKFSEMETMEFVLQYPFGVLEREGFPYRGKWHEEFFHNSNPVVLELGCGKGEYTVGLARRYPDKNFIGIDIKGARMWTGACQARDEGLGNVAFLRTDIELLDHFFAPGEVAEIWITFPDPQMKKATKRLTGTRMVELYRRVLAPGATVHLKTDSPFLYAYTEMMCRHNGLAIRCADADIDAGARAADPVLAIRTHYESQWLDRGLTIKYLSFVLPAEGNLAEPEIEIEHDTYRSYSRGYIECPQLLTETHKNDETRTISGADN